WCDCYNSGCTRIAGYYYAYATSPASCSAITFAPTLSPAAIRTYIECTNVAGTVCDSYIASFETPEYPSGTEGDPLEYCATECLSYGASYFDGMIGAVPNEFRWAWCDCYNAGCTRVPGDYYAYATSPATCNAITLAPTVYPS